MRAPRRRNGLGRNTKRDRLHWLRSHRQVLRVEQRRQEVEKLPTILPVAWMSDKQDAALPLEGRRYEVPRPILIAGQTRWRSLETGATGPELTLVASPP